MFKRILVVVCLLAARQAWNQYSHRELDQPDGVLVAAEPVQVAINELRARQIGEFQVRPLANFSLRGRVLLVSRYRMDFESNLAPYDLGIGWQRMSDSAVLRGLDFTQTGRFLLWHWRDAPPIPEDEITRSATNIHLIPADAAIEARIAALRPGQVVSLKGQLVEAATASGWLWRSSLRRDDGGAGACELMYVEEVSI